MTRYKLFTFKNFLLDFVLLIVCLFIGFLLGIYPLKFLGLPIISFLGMALLSLPGICFFYLTRRQHTFSKTIFQIFISYLLMLVLYYLFYCFINPLPISIKALFTGWPVILILLITVLSKHIMDDELNYKNENRNNIGKK